MSKLWSQSGPSQVFHLSPESKQCTLRLSRTIWLLLMATFMVSLAMVSKSQSETKLVDSNSNKNLSQSTSHMESMSHLLSQLLRFSHSLLWLLSSSSNPVRLIKNRLSERLLAKLSKTDLSLWYPLVRRIGTRLKLPMSILDLRQSKK